MMAAKTQPMGRCQKWIRKVERSGEEGRKAVLLTWRVCLSRVASSPTCGIPMKMMMEMAAAYSARPMRM